MNRAKSASELREAMQPWGVPTFSVVYADTEGHIGYQAVGRIPLRSVWDRGYRPGWDPAHQWQGLIPYEGMPHLIDPERGWAATANNRPAPEDFPYPLSGTWGDGNRARRIRQLLGSAFPCTLERFGLMQQDCLSLRAEQSLPGVLKALEESASPVLRESARFLKEWDCRMEKDRIGATLFEAFYVRWVRRVLRERFDNSVVGLLSGTTAGLATALLDGDLSGWFHKSDRQNAIRETMTETVEYLVGRLGPDMSEWQWGRLHLMPLRHALSGRGDLGRLLDQQGGPVPGCAVTVFNTGSGGQLEARMGACYRMLADLGSSPPVLWASDAQSESGHPGSPHYGDQLRPWMRGDYHALMLARPADPSQGENVLTLEP
jgi:penicillin amidase